MGYHSFTEWSTYAKCPLQHHNRYNLGLRPPQSAAAARGDTIHKKVDKFVKKEDDVMPVEVTATHKKIIEEYRAANALGEHRMYFDRNWRPIDREDKVNRWFTGALDAIRTDLHPVIHIAEWKSGKAYDEHYFQRELYGFCALRLHPDAEASKTTTHYIEGKAPDQELNILRGAESRLLDTWTARIETIEKDQIHAPRPGYYCRWCFYSKIHNGGTCPVG